MYKPKKLFAVCLVLSMFFSFALPDGAVPALASTPSDLRVAALAGGTYSLTANINITDAQNNAGLSIGRNFILDLNGRTLTIDLPNNTGRNGINIANDVRFTQAVFLILFLE